MAILFALITGCLIGVYAKPWVLVLFTVVVGLGLLVQSQADPDFDERTLVAGIIFAAMIWISSYVAQAGFLSVCVRMREMFLR